VSKARLQESAPRSPAQPASEGSMGSNPQPSSGYNPQYAEVRFLAQSGALLELVACVILSVVAAPSSTRSARHFHNSVMKRGMNRFASAAGCMRARRLRTRRLAWRVVVPANQASSPGLQVFGGVYETADAQRSSQRFFFFVITACCASLARWRARRACGDELRRVPESYRTVRCTRARRCANVARVGVYTTDVFANCGRTLCLGIREHCQPDLAVQSYGFQELCDAALSGHSVAAESI
jgi:hypothetical protein